MGNDDDAIFRRAISGAKPLKTEKRAAPPERRPKPKARFSRDDEASVLKESLEGGVDEIEHSSGEALRYHRPEVGRRTMRKLARGNFSVQAEIDLHGMTVAEAKPRLEEFIEGCVLDGKYCIRVIHGKGLGSGQRGPVLKSSVDRWLRRWQNVLAFVSARQVDGGSGAVYVLLRN